MVDRVTFSQDESGATPPTTPTPPQDENRPAWKPEGFEGDEAAIAKSWADQRAEITRLQQELAKHTKQSTPPPPAPNAATTPPADGTTAGEKKPDGEASSQDEAAREVADAAGVDLAPYQTEFDTNGDVSEESRAKIAEGLKKVLGANARQIVDDFIDSRKVVVENDTRMFYDAAGGEENYGRMATWAAQNLPKQQLEAYNAQVTSGDRHAALFTLDGLKAKYEAANGKIPARVLGGGGPAPTQGGFASSAEMRRAMADPRYKTDEAYRAQVASRLAVSNF